MKVTRLLMAAVLAALVLVVVGASPAHAVTVTVTPDRGLVDGQSVRIQGSGFNPGATIGICQAIHRTPPAVEDCGETAVGSSDSTGRVDESFSVRRLMFVRSVGREVDCLVDQCELRISEIPLFLNPAFVPIEFVAAPPPVRPLVTTLTGYREVDAQGRKAAGDLDGIGGARITFPDINRLCFRLEASGIALPALAAHIHSGVKGENGDIVVALTPPGTGGTSSGCVTVDPNELAVIATLPNRYYVNIHTSAFPNGAIRGNLTSVERETAALATRLNGRNEVGANGDPGAGDPDGFGVATVSINDARVCFSIGVRRVGLPALAAHIHQAPAGVNGDIVVPLTPPGADGTSGGCVPGVSMSVRNQLRSDPAEFYVNVHTGAFPNGAVRGNLASVTS